MGIPHDAPGFARLAEASRNAPELWRPTSYWRPYAQRITREIDRAGLGDLRTNQAILKGFAEGGLLRPTLPRAKWKRALWETTARLPVVSAVIGEYERLLAAYDRRLRKADIALARLVLDAIAARYPDASIPAGLDAGGADDVFEWRGAKLSVAFVPYLARAADFYAHVPAREVCSMVEIGSGLGWSTLAHIALNPHLRLVANVDIFPVVYVGGRFLATLRGRDTFEAASLPDDGGLRLIPGDRRTSVYFVPSWRFEDIDAEFDYAFNAYSFQEMEEATCRAYAAGLLRCVRKGVLLHSRVAGHRPGAGGQAKSITLDFLVSLFADTFSGRTAVADLAAQAYGEDPDGAQLLQR